MRVRTSRSPSPSGPCICRIRVGDVQHRSALCKNVQLRAFIEDELVEFFHQRHEFPFLIMDQVKISLGVEILDIYCHKAVIQDLSLDGVLGEHRHAA